MIIPTIPSILIFVKILAGFNNYRKSKQSIAFLDFFLNKTYHLI